MITDQFELFFRTKSKSNGDIAASLLLFDHFIEPLPRGSYQNNS